MGVIIDRKERYALRSAEVYMCLEQKVVFIRQLPSTTCRYIKNPVLLIKALLPRCIYIKQKLHSKPDITGDKRLAKI